MSNWIVTIRRGTQKHWIEPEIEATLIVPDQVTRYPMVTLQYKPDHTVVTTVVMENCTKAKAIEAAPEWTKFMLKETEYIGR